MKTEKKVKAPGALRRPIKMSRFISKFEKLLEHPGDKKFFVSCFEEREGFYYIKDNFTKDEVKKLKKLLKDIKANRKAVIKFLPIILVGGIAAFLFVFFTVFANPLLGKALEKGLEAAFEAKADVRGFRLSLIKFEISVKSITVANRDKPMTNLFDVGRIAVILKPQAVLRGKVYIEEISAAEIRFGAPRKYSGALPGKPPKEKKEKPPKPDAPPLVDLKNFDAMALLNSEFDKLNTPKLYDLAINSYNDTSAKWQKQVDDSSVNVKKLQSDASALSSLNVNNIRDIETAKKEIDKIKEMINSAETASKDVQRIANELESDFNSVKTLEANARNSITDDLNHLKSFIDLGSGAAFAALEPYIRDMLSDTAEQYLNYGLMALNALDQLKGQSSNEKPPKPKKEKKVVFKGKDIHFPTAAYPAFYLGKVASDFTLDAWNWSLDLKNISSDPDFVNHRPRVQDIVTDGPVKLTLGLKETGGALERSVGFNGSADFRTKRQEIFKADVDGKGFPLNIGNQFGNLGISGFSGNVDFNVNMTGLPGSDERKNFGNINAGGNVIVKQAQLLEPKGTIAEAVGVAVKQAGNVNLGIQYKDDKLNLNTNLAQLIENAIRGIVNTYKEKAAAEIERVLRQKINEYIDGRFASKEQLDTLLNIAKGDKAIIEQTKAQLNSKINDLQRVGEQQVRQVVDDATQQAKDEAERQAQALKEEAEKKAKEEAQKKAGEAAKSLLPGLPGKR